MGSEAFRRADALRRLAATPFDVVVVGGGVTGCGTALDAAARGLRTALIERDDWAWGTSSRSSKMVHGGLRYLQQGEVRLVYEALAERERLRRNAPHLVRVLEFVLPVLSRDGVINPKVARALGSALWTYDLTGGLRSGRRHRRLDAAEVLRYLPGLRPDRVAGGYLYVDAQVDDARLTLALARTAALDHAAVAVNRVEAVSVEADRGRVSGVRVRADGVETTVATQAVINAAGVWAGDVAGLDPAAAGELRLRPAKGVHITLPSSLVPARAAVVVPVPGDRRSVFIVPWEGATFVGTTDTDYAGPRDRPTCTAADVDYLLRAVNAALTVNVGPGDVIGTWAGLRPLVADDDEAVLAGAGSPESESPAAPAERRTADLSRTHRVVVSPSGVVSVIGGKLTTYRRMAADAVDAVVDRIDDRTRLRIHRRSTTKRLRLRGAAGYAEVRARGDGRFAGDAAVLRHLADRHGGEARVLLAMIEREPHLGRPLAEGLPYLRAEAVYAARYEMATTVDDVLTRRTRATLVNQRAASEAADDVAALVAPELGWDGAEARAQAHAYRAELDPEPVAAEGAGR